ncbi:MAG: hypothetical protein B6243_00685 [Anaerolineaceae bacterium 4572_5.2]|nr:MAG: hypothetical protein B6243_00685 [Anaerolineaceae bacterium 4572_5.2]
MKQPSNALAQLYANFNAPIAGLDCGKECAPYNEHGVPFCCHTNYVVPVAYHAEWEYLRANTEMWHLWEGENSEETESLQDQISEGQILLECQGADHCQREFRTIACRAFPFFPYLNSASEVLGLAYYDEYKENCWVMSNLDAVTQEYRAQFVETFEKIFSILPHERQRYYDYSRWTRDVFKESEQPLYLLHRDGNSYAVDPATEELRHLPIEDFPAFGVYAIAAQMPFPSE